MPLKPSQMKFVNEYFRCNMNATRAYMATHPKASYETARREGSTNLSNPDISVEITRRLKEQQISSDEVLKRLSEQAQGKHGEYITENGNVDIEKLVADGKGYLIKKVKRTVYHLKDGEDKEYTEIEFYDGQKALELMGKYHALFVDKIDHTTNGESINIETMKPSEIAERVAALLATNGQENS